MNNRTNIFGGNGYLTDDQRKEVIEHSGVKLDFKTCVDLSQPIIVTKYGINNEVSITEYSKEVAMFICYWTKVYMCDLNGFSGFHHVKFDTSNIKIIL